MTPEMKYRIRPTREQYELIYEIGVPNMSRCHPSTARWHAAALQERWWLHSLRHAVHRPLMAPTVGHCICGRREHRRRSHHNGDLQLRARWCHSSDDIPSSHLPGS